MKTTQWISGLLAGILALALPGCGNDDDEVSVSPDGKRLVSKIICIDNSGKDNDSYTLSFGYTQEGVVNLIKAEDSEGNWESYTYTEANGQLDVTNTYRYADEDGIASGTDHIRCDLNGSGYVTKLNGEDSDYTFVYTYEYDAAGYCTAYSYNGRQQRTYTHPDGNVTDGGDSSPEKYTYSSVENKANLDLLHLFAQTYAEDDYYLALTGRIGKPAKNLLASMERYGSKYAHNLKYEFDKDGYVTDITDSGDKASYRIEYK